MSFKINKYPKSRELFDRATKVIPSGVYGHLGPAEGCFIPVTAFPLFGEKAQGTYFWECRRQPVHRLLCAYAMCSATADEGCHAAALSSENRHCTNLPAET